MPIFEATIRSPNGQERKERVFAQTTSEAKRLLEQMYGGPRAVPYLPHIIAG